MFRAAVLSIVLTLAAGQQAALLCRIWCPPDAAATPSTCQHEHAATSLRVTENNHCATLVLNASFLREDVGPRGLAGDHQLANAAPSYRLASVMTAQGLGQDPARLQSPRHCPLETALRL